MSTLRAHLTENMKTCMKEKDELGLSTVRLILSALKDKDIDARGKGRPDGLNDGEIMSMLQTMIKQRQESAKIYVDNNRPELAAREDQEIAVIQTFLPTQLDEAATKAAIKAIIASTEAAGIKDMGKVMAVLKDTHAGQIDMTKAGPWVKALLN
ncbi:MAG: GatB/YqeY domain-containing protein [Pseudomonadota bacterium]